VWLLVVGGHLESWYHRTNLLLTPKPRYFNGYQRRKNPRTCVLCGGPMWADARPAKTILRWFQCGRCHRSQEGVW